MGLYSMLNFQYNVTPGEDPYRYFCSQPPGNLWLQTDLKLKLTHQTSLEMIACNVHGEWRKTI